MQLSCTKSTKLKACSIVKGTISISATVSQLRRKKRQKISFQMDRQETKLSSSIRALIVCITLHSWLWLEVKKCWSGVSSEAKPIRNAYSLLKGWSKVEDTWTTPKTEKWPSDISKPSVRSPIICDKRPSEGFNLKKASEDSLKRIGWSHLTRNRIKKLRLKLRRHKKPEYRIKQVMRIRRTDRKSNDSSKNFWNKNRLILNMVMKESVRARQIWLKLTTVLQISIRMAL